MMKLRLSQGLDLSTRLVKARIVNCLAAWPRERQIADVDALDMPYPSIARQEEGPRGFGRHDVDI